MSSLSRLALAALLSVAIAVPALAAEPVNTLDRALFGFKPSGVALRGYDTVAYFTEGRPVEGSEDFVTDHEGAEWRFASQEHLDLFVADPDRYAPRYGGYCAYGVTQNGLVKIEPDLWTIVDDRLYLNYDKDVQAIWKRDIPGYIAIADDKFDGLLAN